MNYKFPKTQEELFNDMRSFKFRAQNLAGYVQNDFDKLLEDGCCEKEDILYSMKNLQEDFNSFVEDYRETVKECLKYMSTKT